MGKDSGGQQCDGLAALDSVVLLDTWAFSPSYHMTGFQPMMEKDWEIGLMNLNLNWNTRASRPRSAPCGGPAKKPVIVVNRT
jgi:hypothetical protein